MECLHLLVLACGSLRRVPDGRNRNCLYKGWEQSDGMDSAFLY